MIWKIEHIIKVCKHMQAGQRFEFDLGRPVTPDDKETVLGALRPLKGMSYLCSQQGDTVLVVAYTTSVQ